MIVSMWTKPTAIGILVLSLCACSRAQPAAPTPTTAPVGTVTGLVRGEAPKVGRSWRNHPTLANATVTVIGGAASGTKVTTDADGHYEIIGAGTFKLRFEHPKFLTSESIETSVTTANAGLAMEEVLLKTAPWTISGRVIDSLGNGVPNADVGAGFFTEGFFLTDYGRVRTDSAGSYVLNSTQPHFETVVLGVSGVGIVPMSTLPSATCCGVVPDIRVARVVRITPTAPTVLRVGESVEVPASTVVYDTGESHSVFLLPTSSAPAVVSLNRSNIWYAMRGVSPGVATLTFDEWGAVVTTEVTVR